MTGSASLTKEVRKVDGAGRLNIGRDKAGEQYLADESADGTIVLTPVAVIPRRELWLHHNAEAMASVQRGLADSAAGRTMSLGSFAQYADDEIQDET